MPTTDIVIFSGDAQLQAEVKSAANALGEAQPRLRFAGTRNELVEAVRSRPPTVVLAPFGDDPSEVSRLSRELATFSPAIPVAAVLRLHGFGDDVSESSVLIDAMRCGVRDFLRRPISANELRALVENVAGAASVAASLEEALLGRVVSFISNKGGVGKSTLATNVAVGLGLRHPGRVLLIDGSLQMGVAAALLDVRPQSTLSDAAKERDRLDVTMIRQIATQTPFGVHLLAAPADAVEAIDVDDTLMSRIISLGRRAYDYVIIDTFPMFDRVVVAALDLSDRAYVVMENVVPTLLGAVKMLEVLERIGFPAARQSVVINRHQSVMGSLSLLDVAARLGRQIDHVLPFDKRVIEAANSGEPIGSRPVSFAFGGFTKALRRLVEEVERLDVRSAGGELGSGSAVVASAADASDAIRGNSISLEQRA